MSDQLPAMFHSGAVTTAGPVTLTAIRPFDVIAWENGMRRGLAPLASYEPPVDKLANVQAAGAAFVSHSPLPCWHRTPTNPGGMPMQRSKWERSFSMRRRALMLGSAAGVVLPTWQGQAQTSRVLNIATSGDPGPLDPTPVTSDLLSEITQLFYETLYIFGPDFSIAPLLAAALPEISDGGKRYVIKLRSGVPYHDGSTMNADDVVASLQRWGRLSPRGRTPWAFLDSISAKDPTTVEIVLKQPYSPLLNLLAFPNGSPQIMPKRVATAPDPLKDFTGTGPFKLIEYKPDTWVRVGKFAQYVSPPGTTERLCRPARGAGG